MKYEINLEQGSLEWLDFRRSYRMASETPGVMAVSEYQTPNDVRNAKRGKCIADNPAMRHGREQEEFAREAYTNLYEPMRPAVYVEGEYGCSLDGINMEEDLILEIKTPFKNVRKSARWVAAEKGDLIKADYAQIQHQLMVTNAKNAHLWVWDAQNQEGILVNVDPCPKFWDEIREAWNEFWQTLEDRDDKEWEVAANEYLKAKQKSDLALSDLAKAKEALIELSDGRYCHGFGVEVKKVNRKGSTNWKDVQKQLLSNVDLDPFRKQSTEYFDVRIKS